MIEFEEKRPFSRINANCRMTFKHADAEAMHDGLCINISGSGILFQADNPVEPGKAIEIHTLPNNAATPPLTAFIEVVRCTEVNNRGHYHIAGTVKGIKSE